MFFVVLGFIFALGFIRFRFWVGVDCWGELVFHEICIHGVPPWGA